MSDDPASFLVALLVALPLAAETMPAHCSWRVTLAIHTGEDSAALAKRLAAIYRGEMKRRSTRTAVS